MGIPGYSVWFQETNPGCYAPLHEFQIDHLYIDANSILHTTLRVAHSWDHFHRTLHLRLNRILEVISPRKTVMIAIDGPAPLAKLLTQRERRKKFSTALKKSRVQKGSVANKAEDPLGGPNNIKNDEGHPCKPSTNLDTSSSQSALTGNSITPGTLFMLDVSLSLMAWAWNMLSSKYGHLKIEISDETVKGEGEVKILGRIARHWNPNHEDDIHAILGDDADLVLMALACRVPRLLVINSALNGGSMARTMPVFCVELLHKAWSSKLLPKDRPKLATKKDSDLLLGARCDLVLLSVMAKGNDYLPALRGVHLDSVRGQPGIWDTYVRYLSAQGSSSTIDSPRVDDDACHSIVRIDSKGRVQLCIEILTRLLQGFCHTEAVRPSSEHCKSDAYTVHEDLFDQCKPSPDSSAYIRGLVWIMDMYLQGECPDYRYSYDCAAPSVSQLILYLNEKVEAQDNDPMHSKGCFIGHSSYLPLLPGSDTPLTPLVSAMALLPARCRHLLPRAVHHLMDPYSSPLKDVYLECDVCDQLKSAVSQTNRLLRDKRLEHDVLVIELTEARKSASLTSLAHNNTSRDHLSGKHLIVSLEELEKIRSLPEHLQPQTSNSKHAKQRQRRRLKRLGHGLGLTESVMGGGSQNHSQQLTPPDHDHLDVYDEDSLQKISDIQLNDVSQESKEKIIPEAQTGALNRIEIQEPKGTSPQEDRVRLSAREKRRQWQREHKQQPACLELTNSASLQSQSCTSSDLKQNQDEQSMEEKVTVLSDRLAQFELELDAAKVANRQSNLALQRHLVKEHPYRPFPVERLVAAVVSLPLNAFSPSEAPLMTFGRSSVVARSGAESQLRIRSRSERRYTSRSADHRERLFEFHSPLSPFKTHQMRHSGPRLSRWVVDEPNRSYCDQASLSSKVSYDHNQPFNLEDDVTLTLDNRQTAFKYVSCPAAVPQQKLEVAQSQLGQQQLLSSDPPISLKPKIAGVNRQTFMNHEQRQQQQQPQQNLFLRSKGKQGQNQEHQNQTLQIHRPVCQTGSYIVPSMMHQDATCQTLQMKGQAVTPASAAAEARVNAVLPANPPSLPMPSRRLFVSAMACAISAESHLTEPK